MSVRVSTCWGWFFGIAMSSAYISFANNAIAQITPDTSLPNNSRVTLSGKTSIIEGGTQAGGNLFHSFQQFSVPTGNTAYFKNASEIRNIISRVTGGSVSNIDGTIRANTANLFLINPNGIIFGQNARLDIGGSFLASTASSLKFADNFEFSATDPQPTPLLTISVPIGLQFPTNPGKITVQGDSQGISGLQVPSNQTLALVGGDISLEGATLKTAGGRIELGSVTGTGLVNLTSISKGFSLGYGAVQNGGNIQLSQQASVDASGEGGGDIQVWGRRVIVSDGSQIRANTQGTERGGALVVNGLELVELIGTSADNHPSGLFTQSDLGATARAGDVTINTHQLLVENGAQVSTSTFGAGKGGDLAVNADSLQIIGTSSPDNQFLSGLFTQVAPMTIGGRVLRATGSGGDVTINTHDLLIENGGQIQAATLSAGNAGNLMVNANTVQLIGTVNTPSGERGSGLVTSANQNSTGVAGNVIINTQQLLLQDGARVNVSSQGTGNAGNLTVNARSIYLNNNATLNADTTSTESNQEQATINISSRDLILRRSNITTKATGSQVIGGNINIDTAVLAALENSNISADSANFRGGQVKIKTTGIFRSPDTQITATGASPELSGTVQINSPDIDPSRGLVQLPTRVVDTSTKIVSSCAALANSQSSEFVVTGRGGLPPSPYEPLSGDILWSDTRFSAITGQPPGDKTPTAIVKHPSKFKAVALVPATGWVLNNIGEVTLISSAPNATPSVSTTAACLGP